MNNNNRNIPQKGCDPCPKGCLNCPFKTCEYNGYANERETKIVSEILKQHSSKNHASVFSKVYYISSEYSRMQWR